MKVHGVWWQAVVGLVMAAVMVLAAGCTTLPADDSPDQVTARAVGDRLSQEMLLERASIQAVCRDGVVTLSGVVRTDAQRARALAVARSTSGVRDVVDRLRDF